MIKLKRGDDLRIELYEDRLRYRGYVYMNRNKILMTKKYQEARRDTLYSLAFREMISRAGGAFLDMSPAAVVRYLTEFERVPMSILTRNNRLKKPSLEADKVLSVAKKKGYAVDFLTHYIEYSSLKSRVSRAQGVERLLSGESQEVDHLGRPINRIVFQVYQQDNQRYNYRDNDLISIPNDYAPSYCAKQGYILAWGDMKQADLRIVYNILLRDKDNYEFLKDIADMYSGIFQLVCRFHGETFDEEDFKAKRNSEYKEAILGTLYGQQSASPFVQKFRAYLATCEVYQEYLRRLDDAIRVGQSIQIEGYFGDYQYVHPMEHRAMIDKGLNTPNQTGTSQLIIMLVNKTLDLFYENGWTEEDVSVFFVRHDEPIFMIKEEAMKDSWILEEVSKIQIDDWTPMEAEFTFGYYYTEKDQALQDLFTKSVEDNKHRISAVEPEASELKPYFPVKKTYKLEIGYDKYENPDSGLVPFTVVAIVEPTSFSVNYIKVDSLDDDTIYSAIREVFLKLLDELNHEDYSAMLVTHSGLVEEDLKPGRIFCTSKSKYSDNQPLAYQAAEYAVHRYLVREGFESDKSEQWIEHRKREVSRLGKLELPDF